MNRYCQVPNKLADLEMVLVARSAFSLSFVLSDGKADRKVERKVERKDSIRIRHSPFEFVVGATPIQSQTVSVSTILVSFSVK